MKGTVVNMQKNDYDDGKARVGRMSAGIMYSEAEERTVERINAIAKRIHDSQFQIGKLVDGLVAVRGGPAYGERTMERLARHPGLECTCEHLRRCWQYYRLMSCHGDAVMKVAPNLKYSHLYQISRLMAGDEDEQRATVTAMAKKAADDHMTVTALSQAVSTHLDSVKKAMNGVVPRSKPQNAADFPAFQALLDTTETVAMAAEKIVAAEEVGHVVACRKIVHQLGFAFVQVVRKLALGDEDSLAVACKVRDALSAAIETAARHEGVGDATA